MKKLIISFMFSLLAFYSFAGDGYKIDLSVSNLKNMPVYLAFYYNGKTYSKDTTILNAKGEGTFTKKKSLDEGVYIVYFDTNKYFDVLIGTNQNIQIKADTTDLSKVEVTGSPESVAFQKLVRYMSEEYKKQSELRQKYTDKKTDSASYVQQYEKLTQEVTDYQQKAVDENKGTFFSVFVKGTMPVDVPEFENLPDSLRPMAKYQYSKNHFFDNINLTDPRFLRTPYFSGKVDNFISKQVIQIPDSLTETAIDLIEKSKGNKETFQNMTSKMMNYAIQSKMMGMDGMMVALADRYYLSGQTESDSTWLESLRKEVKKARHNLIGMNAYNLVARDSNNKVIQLKDIKDEIVLVYFFEPTCGHCQKTTPVLHDSVYAKWKDKGFGVFAFYTQQDKKEWLDFIHKDKLTDWTNVWDPNRESFFWDYYDVSATPGIYLLDKDRKIIAKKVDMSTLDKILEEELVKRKQKK